MKPAPFGYHRPSSVREAVALLEAYEGDARILSGGQSLVPMLNMRLMRPDALVDVNAVAELESVRIDGATTTLGALVRYSTLETTPDIAERLPLLTHVVRHVGDRQVRNRGTVGGSLAHGDPTAEVPLSCLVLGAEVEVAGPQGTRRVPVSRFYVGSYATVLGPCEMIVRISFPPAPRHFAFAEQCRRHNDFAVISAVAVGDRASDGSFNGLRIGLGGVADTPLLATAAGAVADGTTLSDEVIAEAAAAALEGIDPPSDVRASAEYRRHLVPVYVRRVLRQLREDAGADTAVSAPHDHHSGGTRPT